MKRFIRHAPFILVVAFVQACVGTIGNQPGADGGTLDTSTADGTLDAPADTAMMCATGQSACGSPPTCVTLASDNANCGACGVSCTSGQFCVMGVCGTSCTETTCGTACVNLQTDPSHCGACGTACPTGQSCMAGVCHLVCAAGEMACSGACVDLTSSTANCGSCGHACASGQTCTASTCTTTSTCTSPMTMCGATCTNTATDSANCGTCGHACTGGESCSAGTCACASGTTACSGACVNTSSDSANCGSCGHACGSGSTCTAGTCSVATACGGPPAGVSAQAAAALALENEVRTAMGVPCATMVTAANTSAQRHCAYYLADSGSSTCIANPHVEVSSCSMYVAAQFWDRMTAAGYTGSPAFEDMDFENNGMTAVQQWIDSVWHRTPILAPWVRDIGYGGGGGSGGCSETSCCDTMDFGVGTSTPSNVVAYYPYANQTGVPTSFNGNYEGPMPQAPPSGWPSGYPITLFMRGGSVTSYTLTVMGSATPISVVWLASGASAAMGLLPDEYVMYAYTPLTARTTYQVHIVGTNGAGAQNLTWTFTTM